MGPLRVGLVLLAALGACKTPPPAAPAAVIADADGAAERSDWAAARATLESVSIDYRDDPVVILRLARIDLEAFGEVDRAEARYERLPRDLKARALHGLGRCALWRGDEQHALDLFHESLAAQPTAECARDLAARLLARGDPADEALDLVEATSGATLRSKLLLAAAGRLPRPSRLPEGWTFALERARLKPLPEARIEVDLYLVRACATAEAQAAMARVLAGDLALRRNP
jgi:tetratricopeptide (TPR) repeat protein